MVCNEHRSLLLAAQALMVLFLRGHLYAFLVTLVSMLFTAQSVMNKNATSSLLRKFDFPATQGPRSGPHRVPGGTIGKAVQ